MCLFTEIVLYSVLCTDCLFKLNKEITGRSSMLILIFLMVYICLYVLVQCSFVYIYNIYNV